VASLGAYTVGLNMTAASAVIFYEPFPRPEFYKQAKDRIWRIGQKRDTKAFLLYIRDSIEEHTWDLLTTKIDTMTKFIDGELPPTTLVEILEEMNKEIIKEAVKKTFSDLKTLDTTITEKINIEEMSSVKKEEHTTPHLPEVVSMETEQHFIQQSLF